MTIVSLVSKITATGNGTRRTFSFSPMILYADSELEVVTRVVATGVETVRTLGSGSVNYSLSIPANGFPATGSIDFPATGGTLLPSTEEIVIKRVLALRQETKLESGSYDPVVQELQFDKLLVISQQLQEQLDRALVMPVGTPSTVSGALPPPITGDRYIRLLADLTGYEFVGLTAIGTAAASDATPQGVALLTTAPGTSGDFSRADHTHLVDAYIKLSADIHNALNFS